MHTKLQLLSIENQPSQEAHHLLDAENGDRHEPYHHCGTDHCLNGGDHLWIEFDGLLKRQNQA